MATISGSVVLPGLPGVPIPDDEVELLVRVDRGRCNPPAQIAAFDRTWQRVSLLELVARGAMYFSLDQPVLAQGENRHDARMRRFWQEFMNARPRAIERNGRRRLVFDSLKDPDEKGRLSMLAGEAVAVLMAERMFNVSYTALARSAQRHDHELLTKSGIVRVEARGRFNGGGRGKAIAELDAKFGSARDYSRAVGVLTYPSNVADRRRPDVEVLDPEGDGDRPDRARRIRQVLRHYYEFASRIGRDSLREAYRRLLSLSDPELTIVLSPPNTVIFGPARSPLRAGPFEIRVGNARYTGVLLPGFQCPTWLGSTDIGIVFIGILDHVLDLSFSGRIEELLELAPGTRTSRDEFGTVFLSLSDGTILVWAPDHYRLRASGLRRRHVRSPARSRSSRSRR